MQGLLPQALNTCPLPHTHTKEKVNNTARRGSQISFFALQQRLSFHTLLIELYSGHENCLGHPYYGCGSFPALNGTRSSLYWLRNVANTLGIQLTVFQKWETIKSAGQKIMVGDSGKIKVNNEWLKNMFHRGLLNYKGAFYR